MKEYKYIARLLFKEWLPLIAVFLIVAVSTAVIGVSSHDFYGTEYFPIATFTWPVTMFALVMPFFVFSYRFSRVGGDTYYQLPFKEKRFKNLRVLTGLCAVIFVLLVAFVIGYITLAITYSSLPDVKTIGTYPYSESINKIALNLPYMLIALPISLVFISGVYFTNCAIVSLTNRLPSAIIYVMVVQALLTGLIPSFCGYLEYYFVGSSIYDFAYRSFTLSPGFIGGNILISDFGNGQLFCPESHYFNLFDSIRLELADGKTQILGETIGLFALDILVYAGATVLTMMCGEPSGEYNGTSGARKEYQNYLIYIMTLMVAFLASSTAFSNVFIYAFILIVYTAGLYVYMSIYLGTFKVGLKHALFIGGSALFLIIFPIVSSIFSANLYASGIH